MGVVFLMISRLLYDKGYQEYISAAKLIRNKYRDAEFRLVGSIDEEYPNHVPREVVQRDVDDGIINYLGYMSDIKSVIAAVDCVVHPTFYNEGLSRVLMEALAMSKIIITTDIPGCKETVDNFKNGFLVPPRDVDALVKALETFMALTDEKRAEMQKYARMKAEKEFDVNQVIAMYRKITG